MERPLHTAEHLFPRKKPRLNKQVDIGTMSKDSESNAFARKDGAKKPIDSDDETVGHAQDAEEDAVGEEVAVDKVK